jgi:transcriptional regulator with XRE-family HTH domain
MRSKIAKRILDSTPNETRLFVRKQAAIIVRINQLIKAKGYTQKQLAEDMGKKPSEISRMLKGEHNFTFKSLCHLESVLGEPIIEVPKKRVFREIGIKKFEVTVHRNVINAKDYQFESSSKKELFEGEAIVQYGQ